MTHENNNGDGQRQKARRIRNSAARAAEHGVAAQDPRAAPVPGSVARITDCSDEYEREARIAVTNKGNTMLVELPENQTPPHDGAHPLTDLPPPDTKRWVVRRKAVVVGAVRSGAITLEEACRRYALSAEEFYAWQRAIEAHGTPGLRVTRLQIYRDAPRNRPSRRRR